MTRKLKSNRGKIEIMGDVLNLSTEGIRKTRLMFLANLSYEQLFNYLEELQERGFIEQLNETEGTMYKTTNSGRNFLESYRGMIQILNGDSLELPHEACLPNLQSQQKHEKSWSLTVA